MPRDANGNYFLDGSNPVETGTVISTSWANPTLTDVAAALTDSLSRSGDGGMQVPFRVPDGSAAAPSFSFLNNVLSGLYLFATNDVRMSIGGVDLARFSGSKVQQWSGTEWLDLYQTAALVPFAPTAEILSTDVQAAIEEVLASVDVGNIAYKDEANTFTEVNTAPTAAPGTNTTQLATTEFVTEAVAGGGGGVAVGKNYLINGDFTVNQREVTGTVVLAAGEYGHDRFKGGAAGCTYTFSTLNGLTSLNISAGSLIQVVEGQNITAGDVTLSWGGTAQGQIDGGGFAASGVTAAIAGGVNIETEFNTGTLWNTQLEDGLTATEFEYIAPDQQLAACQRYYLYSGVAGAHTSPADAADISTYRGANFFLPTEMRVLPSVVVTAVGSISGSPTVSFVYLDGFRVGGDATSAGVQWVVTSWKCDAEL